MLSIEQFFASKVVELEGRIQALEGYNQAAVLKFGNVTISTDSVLINTTTSSSAFQRYYVNQVSGSDVSAVAFRRYTNAGVEISDNVFRAYHSSSATRNTYTTMDIYNTDGTRDVFFQMNSEYAAGAFVSSVINFAHQGVSPTFSITMTDATGKGYITIPQATGDPAGAGVGSIYYNTGTGKIRGKHNSGWADL